MSMAINRFSDFYSDIYSVFLAFIQDIYSVYTYVAGAL